MGLSGVQLARFWRRVRREGDCWVWTGPLSGLGYGVVSVNGVQGAHRIGWWWRHGAAPARFLRNSCGRKNCVNPDHWWMEAERVGVIEGRRRLVSDLWVQGLGIGEIADRVGCSRSTVSRYVSKLEIGPPGGEE